MTVKADVKAGELADLVKKVQAGDEVLLFENNKAVAKIVPAHRTEAASGTEIKIRSLKGHRVLTPAILQADIADSLFGR